MAGFWCGYDWEQQDAIRRAVDRLAGRLNRVETRLTSLLIQGDVEMASIQEVVAKVEAVKGVSESVVVLIDTLRGELATARAALEEAIASADPVAIQAAFDGLVAVETMLKAKTEIATAVEANG